MPLCFAHSPSSAWNVLPPYLPPRVESSLAFQEQLRCHLFSAGLLPAPFQRGYATLCAGPQTLLSHASFRECWLVCHISFWLMRWWLLRGTERIIFIFVSSLLAPAGIRKFLVEFIHLTEWFWEVLKGLNSFQILNSKGDSTKSARRNALFKHVATAYSLKWK